MARARTKRRSPGHASDWPVDDYPYQIRRKYVQHPKYVRSHKEAVAYLMGLVNDFEFEMKLFDRDVPAACENARKAIEGIGVDGGHVNVVLAPFTNTRFDAELVRRREVSP